MRCIDGAALVAAAILRQNRSAEVVPFEQKVVTHLSLNSRDSAEHQNQGADGKKQRSERPLQNAAEEVAPPFEFTPVKLKACA